MRSNSSADRPARALLEAAFAVLHAEAPAHHDLVRDAVARLRVHLVIGGEHLAPRVVDGRLAVGDAVVDPAEPRRVVDGPLAPCHAAGERLSPRVVDGQLAFDAAEPPRVTLRISLAAALALLDARRTLLEAVDAGELDVRGSADALDAAADAFSLFLHGMVRAPSSARLLDELRAYVAGSEPGG